MWALDVYYTDSECKNGVASYVTQVNRPCVVTSGCPPIETPARRVCQGLKEELRPSFWMTVGSQITSKKPYTEVMKGSCDGNNDHWYTGGFAAVLDTCVASPSSQAPYAKSVIYTASNQTQFVQTSHYARPGCSGAPSNSEYFQLREPITCHSPAQINLVNYESSSRHFFVDLLLGLMLFLVS